MALFHQPQQDRLPELGKLTAVRVLEQTRREDFQRERQVAVTGEGGGGVMNACAFPPASRSRAWALSSWLRGSTPCPSGRGGIWLQQAAPTAGTAQKAPIPSQYGTGAPLILAGRDVGPGVFAAYSANFGPTTDIRLPRYGGGSVAVGSLKGLHAAVSGVATGPDGRIWVSWAGEINGHGITAFTRSNKAVTRFEPIQADRFTWADLFTLSGDGRLGPLDLLISGTPDVKTGPLVPGIYYARVLPELSATITATNIANGKFKATANVTDAGDAVSGATVSAKGQSKTTNAKGSATLTIGGSADDHVTVTITHPGYRTLKVSIKL